MANRTRHARLRKMARHLLDYRDRPEGDVPDVATNWPTTADNDNVNPEDKAGLHVERRLSIRPTVIEIMREVETGDTTLNGAGQVVAIGALRFSDGTQSEKAYCYGPDGKLIMYDATMPTGSMLGTSDKQERALGGEATTDGNAFFNAFFTAKAPKVAARKEPAADQKIGREQAVVVLADAKANTTTMPTVTQCPTGWPWKPRKLRELFIGMQKGKGGSSGSIGWQDVSTSMYQRDMWAETISEMEPAHVNTIDRSLTAKSFADLADSGNMRTRTRNGQAQFIAANDNLADAYKKAAA